MLYTDSKMPNDSIKSLKEVPMKNNSLISSYAMILTLRRRIEEAYAQSDLPAALALSRQMDSIQLQRWAASLARAS